MYSFYIYINIKLYTKFKFYLLNNNLIVCIKYKRACLYAYMCVITKRLFLSLIKMRKSRNITRNGNFYEKMIRYAI